MIRIFVLSQNVKNKDDNRTTHCWLGGGKKQ